MYALNFAKILKYFVLAALVLFAFDRAYPEVIYSHPVPEHSRIITIVESNQFVLCKNCLRLTMLTEMKRPEEKRGLDLNFSESPAEFDTAQEPAVKTYTKGGDEISQQEELQQAP